MNKQQLQQEIAELQKQLEEKQNALAAMPEKWEPKGGEFYVCGVDGSVIKSKSSHESRMMGAEYATHEQAEKAAKAMRAHNRLLAYVAEFAPDYKFDIEGKNWYVYFDFETNEWDYSYNSYHEVLGVVYMPAQIASDLVDKLNSGEVEL